MYKNKTCGWLIHLFTASGAVLGICAVGLMMHQEWKLAFGLMIITIFIDALDGTLARFVDIKTTLPNFDGALLDNIVDFFNYAMVPACFLVMGPLLHPAWQIPCVIAIVIAAGYQFCQIDAKTPDHFFKGFPSYWNIAVIYLYYWQTSHTSNAIIIFLLAGLSFIPIKYIYPSRMEHLSHKRIWRHLMLAATLLWGATSVVLLITYPQRMPWLSAFSQAYLLLYGFLSLYRTIYPLPIQSKKTSDL